MLIDQIQQDIKNSMVNKDQLRLGTLRLLISEIRNLEIAKQKTLTDEEIIAVVQREIKKRHEASEGFKKGNREESAAKEEEEAKVLSGYLPEQLSDEELTNIVKLTITEVGAVGLSDMGKVIGAVMEKVTGKADGGRVSALVKELLNQ